MKTRAPLALTLTLLLLTGAAGVALVAASRAAPNPWPDCPLADPQGLAQDRQGGAPTVVAYQGEVRVNSAPYTGDGYFKFAVVNADGDTTYWSNDGTSTNGGAPSAAVPLAASHGLFSVLLGDTSLGGGMTEALTADVFGEPDRTLRVWFSTSGDSGSFSPLEPDTRIAAVPYALQASEAVNADTVDGLHAHELGGTHYHNVVIVAKSGGDYTGVQAAVASITDAIAGNPYLVWVAPGVYSETVTMKPHVHLQGAGQEATIISSTASSGDWPPEATLVLTSDASLRDLTVANGGAGTYDVALLATAGTTRTLVAGVTARAQGAGMHSLGILLAGYGTGVTIEQVTALGENGTGMNYGLINYDGSAATLQGGSFTGRGGTYAGGIGNWDNGARLEATDVTALGENESTDSYGLYNDNGAVATLHGGAFTGRGGTDAYGIQNSGSGTTLEAEGVLALGENGTDENCGLGNESGAATTLRGGSFTARGGTNAGGICNGGSGATLEAQGVTALGEDASYASSGLSNNSVAAATVRGGSFTGRGGTNHAQGIYNWNSATLEAEGVSALGEDGPASVGLDNDGAATANVSQSVLAGAYHSIYCVNGYATVSNSRLVGGEVDYIPPGCEVVCVAVSRNTDVSIDGHTCP